MFKRIDHVAFVVKDRAKSIHFYEVNFGFKKYYENNVPVPTIEKIVYLKLGDTILELIHMPAGPTNQGFHFCLESDNFDADYTRHGPIGPDYQTLKKQFLQPGHGRPGITGVKGLSPCRGIPKGVRLHPLVLEVH